MIILLVALWICLKRVSQTKSQNADWCESLYLVHSLCLFITVFFCFLSFWKHNTVAYSRCLQRVLVPPETSPAVMITDDPRGTHHHRKPRFITLCFHWGVSTAQKLANKSNKWCKNIGQDNIKRLYNQLLFIRNKHKYTRPESSILMHRIQIGIISLMARCVSDRMCI